MGERKQIQKQTKIRWDEGYFRGYGIRGEEKESISADFLLRGRASLTRERRFVNVIEVRRFPRMCSGEA